MQIKKLSANNYSYNVQVIGNMENINIKKQIHHLLKCNGIRIINQDGYKN